MADTVKVSERAGGIYTQDIHVRGHHVFADEPESFGSADIGPTPVELVLAGLGSCTSITLRMYAGRKKWPVTHISVSVDHTRTNDGADKFVRQISILGDLDADQRARMLQIANKCPVHKMLENAAHIDTVLA